MDNRVKIADFIESRGARYNEFADEIWGYAETAFREHRSMEAQIRLLEEEGFKVTRNVGDVETAFCGEWGSGKPVIAFLGEFDALAGLSQKAGVACKDPVEAGANGHGCGHNLLGIASIAAAAALKKIMADEGLKGTVRYYGCPGEEGGSGKAFMAREGVFDDVDAALTWHPANCNYTAGDSSLANTQIYYRFRGVSAHAAAAPHLGRSALDAVELMNVGVQFLREHTTPDCRIHYAITDAGGISPNVVQAKASVLYMVRANKVADTVKLQKRVDDIAKGAALMTGTTFERVFIDGTAELVPNFTIEKALYRNLSEIGVPAYDPEDYELAAALKATYNGNELKGFKAAGVDQEYMKIVTELTENGTKPVNDFLPPLFSSTAFTPGSTDVGDVSWLTPTSQISTACWPAAVPGHSWQIVACGKSGLAHKGMLYAAKVLAATAVDLLTDEKLLEEAKAEFRERTEGGYVCPIEQDAVPIAI